MADGYRRFEFLQVVFSLMMFSMPLDSPTEGCEFSENLENLAVYEGYSSIMNLPVDPNITWWAIIPTSNESKMIEISFYGGWRNPTLTGLFYLNQSGLVILNATTSPNDEGPLSTSGLYYVKCSTSENNPAVKLLVVLTPPVCLCNAACSSSNASQLSCSIIYADYKLHPIYANMTWTTGDVVYATDTPSRTRIDNYTFESTSTITVDNSVPQNFTCNVAFNAPTVIEHDNIATNAPEFSASCSVAVCALASTTQPQTTEPRTTTSVCVNGTTRTTTPRQTTTQQPTEHLPISMEPLFGPVAGGTNLKIIFGSETIEYISRYVGSNTGDVRYLYFGEHLSSTLVSLQSSDSSTFEFLAVTPNTTESSTRQPLSVVIEFSPTLFNMAPFNMTSDKTFTYLPNPEITGIFPNNFITSGGTLLDVFGHSLSSVAKPIIQLKIIITRAAEDGSTPNITTTRTSRVCTVPPGNDTYMQCPMPPLNLPEDFLEIINSLYNINVTRRRRSGDPIIILIVNSHSYLSRMKRDVNVLTVNSSNGRDQAEIFLGFIFDGYREYENFNDAFPDTRITFYSAPEINSSNELIQFDPSEDELIYVKGRYMLRGCRLIDYVVHIGDEICANNDLQANQLSCRPPKVEPSSTVNDTIHCAGSDLSITITVGYKQYQYACLTYTDHSRRLALIIGLTVGLGVFAILLTILVICIVRCRKSKVREETDRLQRTRGVELRNIHSQNAERPGSKRNLNIIHTRQNPITLYKPDDDYATSLQQESQQDYGQQIQEYDDYLKPNGDYLTPIDDELNSN